jgi:very-short-patch-repair endonuclease
MTKPHSDVFVLLPQQYTCAMAAALHFKGDAVVGGRAAAAVWGMTDAFPDLVEVTLVGRNAEPQPDLKIRRVPTLHRDDIRSRHGIPLTSPARTLIDLAASLEPLELESALAEARRRRLVSDTQLRAALERAPGRKGTAKLRELTTVQILARTRSYYERKLLALIEAAELPRPLTNFPVEGLEVDMFWPHHNLIVEFDSVAFHSDRQAFERDRLRDQRLVAAGYRVIRITARQLDKSPYAVLARLAQALTITAHADRRSHLGHNS